MPDNSTHSATKYSSEVMFEDTLQDPSSQKKRSTLRSGKRDSALAISTNTNNSNNESFEKNQNVFGVIYELIGIKDELHSKKYGRIIFLGTALLIFVASLTGFFVMWFTEYYDNVWLSNLILSENSERAKSWMNPDPKYDTLLKVHIFNYTNINRYLSGMDEKIIVKDVGPLTYKEHTTKVNVQFNSNFTVTFRDHRTYQFLPENSVCGENEKFMLPNVPLLTASLKVDNMNFFKRLAAIPLINSYNENVFKSLAAHDFLWGYRDNIVGLDFGTGLTHFGLLMSRNGTSVDSLQINTGEDDIRKYSIITQFNGMDFLDFWSSEECNRIDGSDASMFPPHRLKTHENMYVFLQVLCRKIPLRYEKEVTILNNIQALRYRTPLNVFGSPEENPENECYCQNTKVCLPSGVINATKCYNGAPIYPSFPHFFSGTPSLYKDFEGINPKAELHQTYADIHPRFAFPISGASRIQINIAVHKSDILKHKIGRIKEGTILPLMWIEITTGNFTDDTIEDLYITTHGLNTMQNVLKYGTLLIILLCFSFILTGCCYLSSRREKKLKRENQSKTTELETMSSFQVPSLYQDKVES